jgi:hypothetical protein
MYTDFTRSKTLFCLLVVLGLGVCVENINAQAAAPVAPSATEISELRIGVLASANRIRELEGRLAVSERQAQSSAAAAAGATSQAEDAASRYEALRSALSGLGAATVLESGPDSAQQRLVSALAELKATKERLTTLEATVQQVNEKLLVPNADSKACVAELSKALSRCGAIGSDVCTVLAVKPEAGLAIINNSPALGLRAGAKVEIQNQSGAALAGSIVEVRERTACVCYESGLGLTAQIQVGAPVIPTLSSKF